MSKELPYFKFFPTEWLLGDISIYLYEYTLDGLKFDTQFLYSPTLTDEGF